MIKKTITSIVLGFSLVGIAVAGGHGWQRVNYRNSTVFTASIWMNGKPVTEKDTLGAFVNGECRMLASVFMHNDTAYVSSVIHGEVVEPISFKLWRTKEAKAYDCPKTMQSNPGESIQLYRIDLKK